MKRTPLKRGTSTLSKGSGLKRTGGIKKVSKSEDRLAEDKLKKDMRARFYEECQDILGIHSAISGRKFNNPGRGNYHHVKPKESFPEIEFCFHVILPVTYIEHAEVEADKSSHQENLDKIQWVENNFDLCVKLSQEWIKNYKS